MVNITCTVLMVSPTYMRPNEETAVNNYYQKNGTETDQTDIRQSALNEFEDFVKKLRAVGIEVIVYEPTDQLDTPDAHFPNNWLSFHRNGIVGLYPMFAKNRRLERRLDILEFLHDKGFEINKIIDYSHFEDEAEFLEGTGSLVLDRKHKIAYAALSERTSKALADQFSKDFQYKLKSFTAYQSINDQRKPIYHTNVMMCIADRYAIICLSAIDNSAERQYIHESLIESGKTIIDISADQVEQFSGNMLQLNNQAGQPYLVMSTSAYQALNPDQIKTLESFNPIIHSPLNTIEYYGGGSARCMIAEIFLPINDDSRNTF